MSEQDKRAKVLLDKFQAAMLGFFELLGWVFTTLVKAATAAFIAWFIVLVMLMLFEHYGVLGMELYFLSTKPIQ